MKKVGFKENILDLRKTVCNRKSYTLLEVLIVSTIFVIIFAGVISILNVGNKSWNQEMAFVGLQQEIRLALESMGRELRQAEDITITGSTVIEFNIPDITDSIKYSLIDLQIVREHPANVTQILASNISFLNFSRVGDIIEIQLQATKTVINRDLRFPLREVSEDGVDKFLKLKVRLRNE